MNAIIDREKQARGYDIEPIEAALMDTARLIQITPTMHQQADDHIHGLAQHIDRKGSPFEGRILEVYPSGSFAIHTATRSRLRRDMHDADAVIEIDGSLYDDPETILDRLEEAVRGEPGSRYHHFRIERNSRCITVVYPDGVKVDLMPVARIPDTPERVAHLFHNKPETGESYHKEVNPKGFAVHFNEHVRVSQTFQERFDARRFLVEGRTFGRMMRDAAEARVDAEILSEIRADTQPMPAYVPLDQKAPRAVALQLVKRFRDKRYRKHDDHRGRRKPPSIVSAALSLNVETAHDFLFDELIAIAKHEIRFIRVAERNYRILEVRNPAHWPDVFTDRWPETRHDQCLWAADLQHLVDELTDLRSARFEPERIVQVFDDLFGETVGVFVLKSYFEAHNRKIESGTVGMTQSGSFTSVPPRAPLSAPAVKSSAAGTAATSPIRPARANTNMGGKIEDDRH